jgi:bidirectional [NiFe] hydrogenase diaphorase subunit
MPTTLNRASQIKALPAADPRMTKVLQAIKLYQRRPEALIQILHTAQGIFGYLPLNVLQFVSRELNVPPAQVYGVATFYHFFSLKPKGDHQVVVCTGTACYVKGAQKILDALEKGLGLKPGTTTPDGKLGLEQARCIGACGVAPAAVIDDNMQPKVDAGSILALVREKTGVGQ